MRAHHRPFMRTWILRLTAITSVWQCQPFWDPIAEVGDGLVRDSQRMTSNVLFIVFGFVSFCLFCFSGFSLVPLCLSSAMKLSACINLLRAYPSNRNPGGSTIETSNKRPADNDALDEAAQSHERVLPLRI